MTLAPALRASLRARWRAIVLLLIAATSALAGVFSAGASFDHTLSELDGRLRLRPASGDLHLVEIDARSIAAIEQWPWPRSNYGVAVRQLKDAEVAGIAFDVDFSSRSSVAEDQAFAEALKAGGAQVVLPTFGQKSGSGSDGWTDALPIASLRDHSLLAAVSILPDADGFVRRVPIGTITGGVPRPSLSSIIAGVSGTANSDFPIDLSIDRSTIPRHSFIDILQGKFDPAELAGKQILIGAAAVELGDRYAVPGKGVIPGVVIQALAAETLRRGIPRESGWFLPLFLAMAMAADILRLRSRAALAVAAIGAPVILFALNLVAHAFLNWRFEIAPAIFAVLCTGGAALIGRLLASAKRERMYDRETGMPNKTVLVAQTNSTGRAAIISARIVDFDKLTTGLGESAAIDLVCRLRDRIALAAGTDTICRVEDRVIAWVVPEQNSVDDQLLSLRAFMLNPIEVAGRRVTVALAIGVSAMEPGTKTDRTLAKAMLAAETALASEKGWHFHNVGEEDAVDLELTLLGDLDDAIANGQINVAYQPKLCLRSDTIVGVEALVRWKHPVRGPLRPDLFIPIAEKNNRIAGLTLCVLGQTIADLQQWQYRGHDIKAAVNISAKLLNSKSFIVSLRQLIEESRLDGEMLTFEVTESAAMIDTAQAVAALQSFKDLGIRISIDDYGTGQSTLSYLRQLPLDELKIDRSFVQFAHENRGDRVLVRSTIDLAHDLGLEVVAEGVEDEACLSLLRSLGCDLVQGYLISKPIDSAALEKLLSRAQHVAA